MKTILLGSAILGLAVLGLGVEGWSGKEEWASLLFAGDVMLEGEPERWIARGQDPFSEFADLLQQVDVAIANLECPVATVGEKVEKPWTFRASPLVLPILGKYFHGVSLANNHTGDYGRQAFQQTLDHLKKHKIPYFGGGWTSDEARTPWIVEKKGVRIAILGYNDYFPREFEAGPNWPGVAWAVDEQIFADLKAARTLHRAHLVIPYLHWGWEEYPPAARQKKLARKMIDHGADCVIGAHPHITQGAEYYKGKLIVYSLGNFVFEGFHTPATQTGWLLRMKVNREGIQEWDTVVVRMNEKGIPRLDRTKKSPFGHPGRGEIGKRTYTRF